MSSTVTKKSRPSKRKSTSSRRRPAARSTVAAQQAPSYNIADWIIQGFGSNIGVLPEWKDLSKGKNKAKKKRNVRKQVDSLLANVSTTRFALTLMATAVCLAFYVSHVFATQETLSLLEQQRRDNLRLELQYNQLKGQLDKKISPSVVYQRARELGLAEGIALGPTVEWEMKVKED